jgi:anti-sigma B factor antagonist
MDLEIIDIKQVTVITPRSDIDIAHADVVKQRLTELVDKGRTRLVIDLGQVHYIDSSGLGALVAVMKHARAARGDIKICALQSGVRSVFEMTRLNKVIAIHATRQEAVASWG